MKTVILYILCYLVPRIWCECSLEIPYEKEYAPLWEKKVGDRWFKIPYITRRLELQSGEIIKGYCATKFESVTYSHNHKNIIGSIVHNKNHLYSFHYSTSTSTTTTTPPRQDYMEILGRYITLECFGDSLKHEIYVLRDNMPKCKEVKWSVNLKSAQNIETKTCWYKDDHQIFELSTNNLEPNRILAHVSYDFKELSLQTIRYKTIKRTTADRKANRFLPVVLNDLPEVTPLSIEGGSLNTTSLHDENDVLQKSLETMSVRNPWLKSARYEYDNIIQSGPFINQFNQYHQLLDILWWHPLRVTNWYRFLNALEEHTNVHSYMIYMGTLDVVQIPIWSNPGKFQYLEVKNGYNNNNTVPQYVWTYLESSDGKNPDLYVFGYNSPYAEFFNSNEVKFCTDICSDFDWLKNARSSFHYGNFGIVFCCSPESVKESAYGKKLPYKLSSPVLDISDKSVNISSEEEKEETVEKSEEKVENPKIQDLVENSNKPRT
uniref:Uncharacterized protein n=1 Tax=Glossina brevipalpis TaxID=37001 RepID=A0A1A9VZU9_9MUSC